MSQGSDAADQMTREAIQIAEAAAKLAALGAKNLASLCLALASENQRLTGKTNMTRLLKSGKELRVFDVKATDLPQFRAAAKQYGVLFSVIKHSKDENGNVDVLTRAEDVSKINRILEKMNYTAPVQTQSEEEKSAKKADPRARQERKSNERGTGWNQEDPQKTNPNSIRAKIQQIKIRHEKLPVEPVLPGKDLSR